MVEFVIDRRVLVVGARNRRRSGEQSLAGPSRRGALEVDQQRGVNNLVSTAAFGTASIEESGVVTVLLAVAAFRVVLSIVV